jgi:RimJ/RimL family protein N-acetyltransferase
MIYSRYGIRIALMRQEDIEMVRQWRNDPVVANNYEFRDFITPEMQEMWFRTVNNIHNLYTILEYRNEKIGVINIKNIDWENKTCEGGIFLPDPKFHKTGLPAIISYITTEIIFRMFEWNEGYAHVLKENIPVQQFVKMLGYELMPGQEEENNQMYRITRDTFEKKGDKIRKAINVLTGNDEKGVLQIPSDSYGDPVVSAWEEKVRTSRFIQRVEETPEGRFYYFM